MSVGLKTLRLDPIITSNRGAHSKVKVLQNIVGVARSNCEIGLKSIEKMHFKEANREVAEMTKKARQAKRKLKRRRDEKRKKQMANIVQECFKNQYTALYVTCLLYTSRCV